jgi:hypothetical protein
VHFTAGASFAGGETAEFLYFSSLIKHIWAAISEYLLSFNFFV